VGKPFSLFLSKRARQGLRKVHPAERQKILKAFDLLRINPFPSKAIQLSGGDLMRIRVGDYRILYRVFETQLLIEVINLGHRKDIYKNL